MLKFEELLKSIDVVGRDIVDCEQIKPAVIMAKLESVGLDYSNFNNLIEYKLIEYNKIGEIKFSPVFLDIYSSIGQPFWERITLFKDVVFSWHYRNTVQSIFELFLKYEKVIPLEVITYSSRKNVQELVAIGILKMSEDFDVIVDRNLPEFLEWLDGKEFTCEQLSVIEKYKLELGELAEEIAMDYEISRLNAEGLNKEALKVKLIAKTHLSAGYDIKSFSSTSGYFNRFIEVKAIDSGTFYLSKNERDKALLLKRRYFLYLVNTQTKEIEIINDPINWIDKHFNMEPTEFKYMLN